MNTYNPETSTAWVPFKIPATPSIAVKNITGDIIEGDPYVLSPKEGALNSKNPSSQIEWNQLPINDIINRIITLEGQVSEIESRISNAEINASCDNNGNITITINI